MVGLDGGVACFGHTLMPWTGTVGLVLQFDRIPRRSHHSQWDEQRVTIQALCTDPTRFVMRGKWGLPPPWHMLRQGRGRAQRQCFVMRGKWGLPPPWHMLRQGRGRAQRQLLIPRAHLAQAVDRVLMKPTVDGTFNVLSTCRRSPSVRRVLLTGCTAAVVGVSCRCAHLPRASYG